MTDRLRQRSTNLEPMRKKVISLKYVKYVSTHKQQNTLELTVIKKIAVIYHPLMDMPKKTVPTVPVSLKKFLKIDAMNDKINDCIEILVIIAQVSPDIH